MATACRLFVSSPTYIFLSLQLSINIRFGKSNVNYQLFRTVLKVLWILQSGVEKLIATNNEPSARGRRKVGFWGRRKAR